jgi:uncharacterized protein YdaU (DUF1376 family)
MSEIPAFLRNEFHPLRLTRFDFDVVDFLGSPDVASMPATDVGQYVLLLCHAWIGGKNATLPNDDKMLAKLARAPRGVSPRVLSKFPLTRTAEGVLVRQNLRLTKEWTFACERAQRRHEKAQKAAKMGWEQRAHGMPGVRLKQASSNAQAMLGNAPVPVPVSVPEIKEKSKSSCPPPADEVNAATSQSSRSAPEVSPTGMELANLLRQRIHENNSRARITEKQVIAWGRQVDLMIRMDNRTVEEITVLIEWSQRDPFWKTVVLSMKKLREKFDQLTMKSKVQPIAGEPPWISRERADEEKQREGWRVISKLAKEAGK